MGNNRLKIEAGACICKPTCAGGAAGCDTARQCKKHCASCQCPYTGKLIRNVMVHGNTTKVQFFRNHGLKADCSTTSSITSSAIRATDQFHLLAFLEALFAAPALLNDLALSFFMRALSALDICSMSCCISFTRAHNTLNSGQLSCWCCLREEKLLLSAWYCCNATCSTPHFPMSNNMQICTKPLTCALHCMLTTGSKQ